MSSPANEEERPAERVVCPSCEQKVVVRDRDPFRGTATCPFCEKPYSLAYARLTPVARRLVHWATFLTQLGAALCLAATLGLAVGAAWVGTKAAEDKRGAGAGVLAIVVLTALLLATFFVPFLCQLRTGLNLGKTKADLFDLITCGLSWVIGLSVCLLSLAMCVGFAEFGAGKGEHDALLALLSAILALVGLVLALGAGVGFIAAMRIYTVRRAR